jgi:hypothetical protein
MGPMYLLGPMSVMCDKSTPPDGSGSPPAGFFFAGRSISFFFLGGESGSDIGEIGRFSIFLFSFFGFSISKKKQTLIGKVHFFRPRALSFFFSFFGFSALVFFFSALAGFAALFGFSAGTFRSSSDESESLDRTSRDLNFGMLKILLFLDFSLIFRQLKKKYDN